MIFVPLPAVVESQLLWSWPFDEGGKVSNSIPSSSGSVLRCFLFFFIHSATVATLPTIVATVPTMPVTVWTSSLPDNEAFPASSERTKSARRLESVGDASSLVCVSLSVGGRLIDVLALAFRGGEFAFDSVFNDKILSLIDASINLAANLKSGSLCLRSNLRLSVL